MESIPTWVGPTAAISLVIIAIGFVGIVIGLMIAARQATMQAGSLAREIREMREELSPTIKALARLAESGSEMSGQIRTEVTALLDLSRRLRRKVSRGARRVEHRLEDMDELYQVVSAEVEDTALDMAAKLRALRTGAGALSRIKRMLVKWRR